MVETNINVNIIQGINIIFDNKCWLLILKWCKDKGNICISIFFDYWINDVSPFSSNLKN